MCHFKVWCCHCPSVWEIQILRQSEKNCILISSPSLQRSEMVFSKAWSGYRFTTEDGRPWEGGTGFRTQTSVGVSSPLFSGSQGATHKYKVWMRHRYHSCCNRLEELLTHPSFQVKVSLEVLGPASLKHRCRGCFCEHLSPCLREVTCLHCSFSSTKIYGMVFVV